MFKLPTTIEKNIEHFTGRAWLLPHLLEWIEQTDERIFVLTGDPGTGKSMVAAWLAGAGPPPCDGEAHSQLRQMRSQLKAVHFCIATSGSTDPKALVENIAEQLTRRVAGFGDALTSSLSDQVKISAIQEVNSVEAGAHVTGNHIECLDLGGLSEELSFNRILRQPLQKLYEHGYREPILLLVDSLDEALTYTGKITIVTELSKLNDLPHPVRVLVTTRPDPRVTKRYRGVKSLDLIKDAPNGVNDVQSYACNRLSETNLDDEQRFELADRIAEAAEGIFLYAHLVLESLLVRLPDIANPATVNLPDGLSGLYHDFLNRELGVDEGRWYQDFKPLLGLIAVAQGAGLSRIQLKNIMDNDIEQPLRVCRQYLAGSLPGGPFRPFHRSFADFLLVDKSNIDYHIDGPSVHEKIVQYYIKAYDKRWLDCDEYGLCHLPMHALEARNWDVLVALLTTPNFLGAKHRIVSIYELWTDYVRALDGWQGKASEKIVLSAFEERLRREIFSLATNRPIES